MRKLLGTLVLALILLGAVGFARGWFNFTTQSADDQTKIEITIDKTRVQEDSEKLKDRVGDITDRFQSSSEEAAPEAAPEATGEILPPEMPKR